MDYLFHHGINGQKWGVRRYQNSDGSLTDLGKARTNKRQSPPTTRPHRRRKDSISVADAGALTPEELLELYEKGLLTEKTYREALAKIDSDRINAYNQQLNSTSPLLAVFGVIGQLTNASSFCDSHANEHYSELVTSGNDYLNEAVEYIHNLDVSQAPPLSWNGEYDGMSMNPSGRRKKTVGAGGNKPGMTYRPGHKPGNKK